MQDILWAIFVFVLRALDVVLRVMQVISDVAIVTRAVRGRNDVVKVPAEPKVLPAAAQRALAEAEERRQRFGQTP